VTLRRCLVVLAVLVAAGCGTKAPDYQSVWSSGSAAPTTTATAPPVPISQYLEEQGVVGLPMTPETLKDLTVTVPQPPGWTVVSDPHQQAAYQILRKTDVASFPPSAMVMVFKLMGNFDTGEAIKHGYADAELSDGFNRLNASMDNFRGFPSAMIEGSYNLNGQRLHTYNRIVIATGPQPANQRYLVQFTVTTAADQAQPLAADIEKIISGFSVAAK
jgi:Probable lipoprotein LpqN